MSQEPAITSTETPAAPQTSTELVGVAWKFQVQGDFQHAEEDFRKALDIDPHYVEAYYGLALALKMQGRKENAAKAFEETIRLIQEKALSQDPNRATMLRQLSEAQIGILQGKHL